MEISVKHVIIIVLLQLIAVFDSNLCDLPHEWCCLDEFDERKKILLSQNNCSKVHKYSTKPSLKYSKM